MANASDAMTFVQSPSSADGRLVIDLAEQSSSPSICSVSVPASGAAVAAPSVTCAYHSAGADQSQPIHYCGPNPLGQSWSAMPQNVPVSTQSYPQQISYPFQPGSNPYVLYPMQPQVQMPLVAPVVSKKA